MSVPRARGGRRLRVLTWHVHGTYLRSLSQLPHEIVLPVRDDGAPGYGGRAGDFDWPGNVVEVPAEDVASSEIDVVLHQTHRNWDVDRLELLSDRQRRLPQVVVEHDPPRASPVDQRHPVDDRRARIVHVTRFNQLMWDCGDVPTTVVEHGLPVPSGVVATGELARALVIVNDMPTRGRRVGRDLYEHLAARLPVDLIGMDSERLGGLGEVPPLEVAAFAARYRVLLSPIRWTSLNMSICEAMMIGLPVVGFATTELPSVVENGVSGFLSNDPCEVERALRRVLDDDALARRWGDGARRAALPRFDIDRFVRDWDRVLQEAVAAG
ncbi:glycosyltransferase [Dermatobacter hominis]|uniref:glycosyltransferase n=1 Tax=Dermatobacter hominis TaxID=2884263 RepID=UPI001D0FDA4E|nr:glycosyltransferase [Dermatobacter hominis]UDY37497.1 glycosyltransferase [Dermatobacter hominis]